MKVAKIFYYEKKKLNKTKSAKIKSEIWDKRLKDYVIFFPLHALVLYTVKKI